MLRGFNKDGSYIRTHSAEDYGQILELKQELDKHNIPHIFHEFMDGWQIIFINQHGDRIGDVIEHCGSYGLEAMGFGIVDVEGYLSVEEAFEMFQKAHEEDGE